MRIFHSWRACHIPVDGLRRLTFPPNRAGSTSIPQLIRLELGNMIRQRSAIRGAVFRVFVIPGSSI